MSISFDRAVDYYDETRGFPPGVEVQAAATIAHAGGLINSEKVIEIGVGTGRIALPVAPYVNRYVGIDISIPMMKRLLSKRGTEPVSLVEGSAIYLPFPTATFDAAVAVHIFHLIPDWQQALAELKRVLKPDGRLIHCWNKNDQAVDLTSILKAAFPQDGYEVHSEAVGARGSTYLEDSGWEIKGEETCTFTRQQKPIDAIEMLRSRKWSRTWRMSDEQMAKALEVLEQTITQQFADIHVPIDFETIFHARVYTPPR